MRRWTLPHLAVVCLLAVAGCGDSFGPEDIATIAVSPGDVTLVSLGATQQLEASATDLDGEAVSPQEVTFQWSSSDASVASVSASGVVTAVAEGTATITVSVTGATASGTTSVTVAQEAAAISVAAPSDTLEAGDTTTLSATVEDAGGSDLATPDLTWSSSDESVATVDGSGTVTAVDAGEAVITAAQDGASGTAGLTVIRVAFTADSDTTVSGEMKVAEMTVAAGTTVTLEGDAVIDASGAVSVEGDVVGDCAGLELRGAEAVTISGTVSNACSSEGEAADLVLRADGILTVQGATVESSGAIRIGPDSAELAQVSTRTAGRAAVSEHLEVRVLDGTIRQKPDKAPDGGGEFDPRDGTDGQPIEINGSTVRLDGVTIRAQRGGDGLDHEMSSEEDAGAYAGSGGEGGSIVFRLGETGGIEVTDTYGQSLLYGGRGGAGGDAVAQGLPRADGPVAAHAEARGGGGGSGGSIRVVDGWTVDTPSGAAVEVHAGGGGRGGHATATGADGADATAERGAQAGGVASAIGGRGGKVGDGLFATGIAYNAPYVLKIGTAGKGGDATAISGKGGDGSAEYPDGAAGGDAGADAGDGGSGLAYHPVVDEYRGEGGNGGAVKVAGGDGGHAAGMCVASTETSVSGEIAVESDPANSDQYIFNAGSGIGLTLLLRLAAEGENGPGGTGGDGGSLVGTPGEGGLGGVAEGFAGTATAGSGANGGNGGDGDGPGAGGSGGLVAIVGDYTAVQPLGQDGIDGSPCESGLTSPQASVALAVGAQLTEHTRAITITSDNSDWVAVTGTLADDGTVTAEGRGTVAGVDNILAEFSGTYDEAAGTLTGTYTLDSEKVIVSGHPVVYSVSASTN